MEKHFDFIVVGSGPAAVQAAQTLVEAGVNVAMIDVGNLSSSDENLVPDLDYEKIRKEEKDQFRFLLGENFETIPLDDNMVGAQLTPQRKHMIKDIDRFLPLKSDTFFPMESLGYGGLGAGWGLGCYVYSEGELKKTGLNPDQFKDAYQVVADRIGISCNNDDTQPYTTAHLKRVLRPLEMDNSVKKIYNKYLHKKKYYNNKQIYIGATPLALLSEDFLGRTKTSYHDMDFYTDRGQTAYRAWITVEMLKEKSNFSYIDKMLLLSISESNEKPVLNILNTSSLEKEIFTCNKLLLATGPLGNARIVLRSFENKLQRLPLLCNPYAYVPCININMLGKTLDRFKTSMAQAIMIYDKGNTADNIVTTTFYTYRSLMLYKLIKEAPLGFADGRAIMNYLQSAFVIAGIHHPDLPTNNKYLELHKDPDQITGDILFAEFKLTEAEDKEVKDNEKYIRKILRSFGCFPIQRIDPGIGSSIHYGGTLPFSEDGSIGTTAKDGHLNGFSNVYIADGSAFTFLSAKGITFTLMANAHLVALNSLK